MTPSTTHFVQELFRETVRRLNELHIHTIEAAPEDVRALHQLWEVVDDYQTNLTKVIQTHVSSPNE